MNGHQFVLPSRKELLTGKDRSISLSCYRCVFTETLLWLILANYTPRLGYLNTYRRDLRSSYPYPIPSGVVENPRHRSSVVDRCCTRILSGTYSVSLSGDELSLGSQPIPGSHPISGLDETRYMVHPYSVSYGGTVVAKTPNSFTVLLFRSERFSTRIPVPRPPGNAVVKLECTVHLPSVVRPFLLYTGTGSTQSPSHTSCCRFTPWWSKRLLVGVFPLNLLKFHPWIPLVLGVSCSRSEVSVTTGPIGPVTSSSIFKVFFHWESLPPWVTDPDSTYDVCFRFSGYLGLGLMYVVHPSV